MGKLFKAVCKSTTTFYENHLGESIKKPVDSGFGFKVLQNKAKAGLSAGR